MASTISSSPSPQTPDLPNQGEDKYTAFVEKRLQQTAGHVKLVDLFGGLMFLLGGLIAGLLALAVVDAWLFELGSPVRLIALLVMIAVTGWFLAFRITPLLMRRINPAYAAKMIEDGHPQLKNSLINHVFFQQDPENARRIINRAMSRKAAEDISTVTIETAVDRSHMIRAAIFFVAALAIFGLYKVVSPKDPFKTVARIVAPLSDITRPSRVDISQIEPGDTEVFFGESVEVIAAVDGLGKSESAFVVYSTHDGQARDKRIPMKSSPSDDRYRATLSTGDSGIQQNLTYRILAGDATSSRFRVAVKPRPSFVVQNVHIKPPAYTRLEPFSQKQGNVASVEGAEITVEALANLPVQSAFVQLLVVASEKDDTSERNAEEEEVGEPSVVESIPMIVDEGTRARGTFRLQMRGDHVTPRFTHYRVGFVTADGIQNNNPAVFRIRTTPDLKPEIEILVPEESEVTIAQNGVLKMTIRAIDPDYEVTDIRLVGDSRGVSLFDKTIFGENVSAPRVELFHAFRPDDFGLRAGQQVLLQSVALDNRQSTVSDLADPNRAKSRQILVRIGPPQEISDEANQDGDEDQQQPDQEDPQNKQDDSTQDQNEKQNDRKQSGKQDSDEQKDEKQGSGASESESNDQKQPQKEQSQNEQSKKQESDSDSNKNQKKSEQSEQSESQESNSKQQNSGEDSDSNSKQQSQSDSSESSSSSDSSESGEQTGDQSNSGQSNNQTGESGSEPMKSDNKSGSSSSDKNTQSGDSNQADPTNSSEDQSDSSSSDPVDHPGEAFEKIKQHLEEKKKKDKQQQSDRDSSNDSKEQSERNDAASESEATDQQSNGETKDQEDKQSSANDTENQQRPEDASAGDSSESKQTESQDKGNSGSKSSDDSSQQQQGENKSDNQQRSNSKSGEKKDSTEKGTARENSGKGTDESQKKSQKQDADSQGTGTQRSESGDDEEKTNQQKNAGEKNGKRDDTQENGKSADSQHEDQASEDQTGEQKSGDQKSGDDRGKGDPANKDDSTSSAGNSDRDEDKTGSRKSNDSSEQQESKDNKNESASQQDDRGEEAGSQRENRSGDKSAEKTGDETGEDNGDSKTKSDSRDDSNSKSQSSPKGTEAGKGDRDPDAATAADSSGDSPGADDPNLEYSRKATEMVLDYLKDQEENPDRELLDELKWSEAEMRDFYQKWQRMREQAEKGGAAEQRSYEEALRSLGLSPQPEGIGQESIDQKKIDHLREDGTRSKPPAHLLEEFRSFNKERSRK